MIWLGQNLYNIISEPRITINLISVMKTRLKETFSNIHLLKLLSHKMVWDKEMIRRHFHLCLQIRRQEDPSKPERIKIEWDTSAYALRR
jgi:hypothetical protein